MLESVDGLTFRIFEVREIWDNFKKSPRDGRSIRIGAHNKRVGVYSSLGEAEERAKTERNTIDCKLNGLNENEKLKFVEKYGIKKDCDGFEQDYRVIVRCVDKSGIVKELDNYYWLDGNSRVMIN